MSVALHYLALPPQDCSCFVGRYRETDSGRSGGEMGADTRQAATFQCDLSGSPRVLGDLEVSPTERPRGVRTEHLGQHASALPTGHAAERCAGGRKDLFPPKCDGCRPQMEPCKRRRVEARSSERPHDRCAGRDGVGRGREACTVPAVKLCRIS